MQNRFINRIFGIILLTFLIFFYGWGQTSGHLEVVEDAGIKNLIDKHIEANAAETMQGYRIQLYVGSDRSGAKDTKVKFLQLYPDVNAYEVYQQPNFKVRVGDFRTRLEAQKFLTKLTGSFSGAFVVSDEINLPKLE